jgi:hypothetical protein
MIKFGYINLILSETTKFFFYTETKIDKIILEFDNQIIDIINYKPKEYKQIIEKFDSPLPIYIENNNDTYFLSKDNNFFCNHKDIIKTFNSKYDCVYTYRNNSVFGLHKILNSPKYIRTIIGYDSNKIDLDFLIYLIKFIYIKKNN